MPEVPAEKIFERYRVGSGHSLAELGRRLHRAQMAEWPACRRGNDALTLVKTRGLRVGGFEVRLQWNPQRIVSTAANVDSDAIASRPCFLCLANLPPEQRGVLYQDDYLMLCNPSPIFPEHFTIAHIEHKPQGIDGLLPTMLTLTESLGGEFTLFYNGPKCGASAPDHLHLQAVPNGSMPLDRDVQTYSTMFPRENPDSVVTWSIDGYGRTHCILSSERGDKLAAEGEDFVGRWRRVVDSTEEPLMNVVTFRHEGMFHLVFFLRSKHRPAAYFKGESERILVSPASVDMGGHIVTPREEDFHRLDEDTIAGMYAEVSEHEERLMQILNR